MSKKKMPPPRPAFSKCNLAFKYLPRVWLSFPILVRHRVHAQPHRHQLVVHISYAEVFVARFLVALLTSFYLIQRCSPPLAGVFAGERRRVIPHGFSVVWEGGFMCWCGQFVVSFSVELFVVFWGDGWCELKVVFVFWGLPQFPLSCLPDDRLESWY